MATARITRRSLLIGGATLAASAAAHALPEITKPLAASDIVARIKTKVGIPWQTNTVDKFVAGDPAQPVKGIAVTMMATLDVLERAAAAGHNFVITHEPTFYSHLDTTAEFEKDPLYLRKAAFIREHQLAIFRFHDHWHGMTPDGIDLGMQRELGWTSNVSPQHSWLFHFPETPLRAFSETMAAKLNAHSMRIVGNPTLPVRTVAALWGYASLIPDVIDTASDSTTDLLIVGETREWELVEYIQDQITAGNKKALIVLNHVVSEQAGMKYCAAWLKPIVPELPIVFVPTTEPFWTLPTRT